MKFRKILLACTILLLFNCAKYPIEEKLKEKDSFWYIFHDDNADGVFENLNYGYEFYSSGKLDYMGFDISTNTLQSFRMDDVKQVLTWDYNNEENSIRIEHKKYEIISTENDTLVLKYENLNKNRILINLKKNNTSILKTFWLKSKK